MPNRSYTAGTQFRYGFNGKENDNEVKGTGNQQDYGMRIYDTRLGKFLSVDPLIDKYPELTPYQFANNSPIANIDLDGAENLYYSVTFNEQGKSVLYKVSERYAPLSFLMPASYFFIYGGNNYYQTDESSWLNPGMGMKMLSEFEGKTKEELDAMFGVMKTDVEKHAEHIKQHEAEIKELFQNAFLGAAVVNTKKGTYTNSNTNKQQQSANNKTNSEGRKFSTAGQQSASGDKTNSLKATQPNINAGEQARSIVDVKNGKFAQPNHSNNYSLTGQKILGVQSIPEGVVNLKNGIWAPANLPIDYVIRDGQVYYLNTRSVATLIEAGIPKSKWIFQNRTGEATFEINLTKNLNGSSGYTEVTNRKTGKITRL